MDRALAGAIVLGIAAGAVGLVWPLVWALEWALALAIRIRRWSRARASR